MSVQITLGGRPFTTRLGMWVVANSHYFRLVDVEYLAPPWKAPRCSHPVTSTSTSGPAPAAQKKSPIRSFTLVT